MSEQLTHPALVEPPPVGPGPLAAQAESMGLRWLCRADHPQHTWEALAVALDAYAEEARPPWPDGMWLLGGCVVDLGTLVGVRQLADDRSRRDRGGCWRVSATLAPLRWAVDERIASNWDRLTYSTAPNPGLALGPEPVPGAGVRYSGPALPLLMPGGTGWRAHPNVPAVVAHTSRHPTELAAAMRQRVAEVLKARAP